MPRTVLITGASSDIGVEFVRGLAADSENHLVCHYNTNPSSIEQAARTRGARIDALPADFTRTEDIEQWIARARSLAPRVDALVFLAAPPLRLARMKDLGVEEYDQQLRVQVVSAAGILRAFLPAMLTAKQGNVVFLLSTVATGPTPGSMAAYVTGKYGLLGLFHATCVECRNRGVRVHGVAPGLVRTKFLSAFPERLLELEAERAESGRLLDVSDVAPVLLRCLNDPGMVSGEIHAV